MARPGSTPQTPMRETVAFVPSRLAVGPSGGERPDPVSDADHKRVADEACRWQQVGASAEFLEMGAAWKRIERDRTFDLVGLMASTGERLGLSYGAAFEVALWAAAREQSGAPDLNHELAMRAMAEAQCLFVMGAGHSFANVAVREIALDPKRRQALAKRLKGSSKRTFAPFSNEKRDYVSMNSDACTVFGEVASEMGGSYLKGVIEPVVEFGKGEAWAKLDERRGEDFHRWRLQTDGIAGVSRQTPWSVENGVGTLGIGSQSYDDARGLADEVSHVATEAMLELARAMEKFMNLWNPPGSKVRQSID